MSTPSPPLPPELEGDELLAAEYALGVLDDAARREFEARLPREAALARAVAAWRERLAPMLDEAAEVAPPLWMWARIRAHLGLGDADARHTPLWQRLPFWRGMAFAGLAATAASLIALVGLRGPLFAPPAEPGVPVAGANLPHPVRWLATFVREGGVPAYVAAVDEDACTILLMPRPDAAVPAGKVAELWVIAGDGVPRSLGLPDSGRVHAIEIPRRLRMHLQTATLMAVSLEPPGGSPTGLPTGPVVAQGRLTTLVP